MNEIDDLKGEIEDLKSEIEDLESDVEDLRDENDSLERKIDELEKLVATQVGPIDITRRHVITLRNAIEAYGGTNSERADLSEVMRFVEGCE